MSVTCQMEIKWRLSLRLKLIKSGGEEIMTKRRRWRGVFLPSSLVLCLSFFFNQADFLPQKMKLFHTESIFYFPQYLTMHCGTSPRKTSPSQRMHPTDVSLSGLMRLTFGVLSESSEQLLDVLSGNSIPRRTVTHWVSPSLSIKSNVWHLGLVFGN